MGFREGEGLGKYGQGRQEIVEASQQKGRRGLGLTLKGFDGEVNINWQDEPEVIKYIFFFKNSPCVISELSIMEMSDVFHLLSFIQVKFMVKYIVG